MVLAGAALLMGVMMVFDHYRFQRTREVVCARYNVEAWERLSKFENEGAV